MHGFFKLKIIIIIIMKTSFHEKMYHVAFAKQTRPSGQSDKDLCCQISLFKIHIMKTCLLKYTENFTTKKKNENFQTKNSDMFHTSQNIDCEYSLEPPLHNLCF